MPRDSYEVTASSSAPPERVFDLLADATSWHRWAGFFIGHSSWARDGVRKAGRWPVYAYEEVIVNDRPTHHAYTLTGNPVKNFRADVYLTPNGSGTTITWGASFDPLIPGTGGLLTAFYRRLIGSFARRLARYAEASTI